MLSSAKGPAENMPRRTSLQQVHLKYTKMIEIPFTNNYIEGSPKGEPLCKPRHATHSWHSPCLSTTTGGQWELWEGARGAGQGWVSVSGILRARLRIEKAARQEMSPRTVELLLPACQNES